MDAYTDKPFVHLAHTQDRQKWGWALTLRWALAREATVHSETLREYSGGGRGRGIETRMQKRSTPQHVPAR